MMVRWKFFQPVIIDPLPPTYPKHQENPDCQDNARRQKRHHHHHVCTYNFEYKTAHR